MAQLNLKSESKLKKLRNKFLEEAKRFNLLDDYLFVQTFNALEDQIAFMEKLKNEVDEKGLMVMAPASKDTTKRVVNPAVSEYNRMATLANKSSSVILDMIGSRKKDPIRVGELV